MARTLAPTLKTVPIRRTGTLRRVLGAEWQLGWLMVPPVVIIVSTLLIYPFFDAILLSFQDRFIGKTGTWVGFANYAALFADTTTPWVKAALTTLIVTGGAIATKVVIGMAMARVRNQDIPGAHVLRRRMGLAVAVPAVVAAYVSRF